MVIVISIHRLHPAQLRSLGYTYVPYRKTGTITNMYDIYIASDSTGGTVTNRLGIYQANSAKNYFGGNIGIVTNSYFHASHIFNHYVRWCYYYRK
jgi:hypothetical protein